MTVETLSIPRLGLFETEEQEAFRAEIAALAALGGRLLRVRLSQEYDEEKRLVYAHCEAHEAVRQAERRRAALAQQCQAQRARVKLLVAAIEARKP